MRKLLLASYQFRTGEAVHNEKQLVAIKSKDGWSDFEDVLEAERVFGVWFPKCYPESTLDSLRIFPAITESTVFPNMTSEDDKRALEDIFSAPSVAYMRQAGVTTVSQALQLTDDQLLRFRGVGKMAIQRLRGIKTRNIDDGHTVTHNGDTINTVLGLGTVEDVTSEPDSDIITIRLRRENAEISKLAKS